MRVISGTARGLKLESLDGIETRPTLDRVKEAVFSILFEKTYDALVLDLFAGSGALGIECLSRGAKGCVFVDINQRAADVIKTNVNKARFTDKAHIRVCDYKTYISGCNKKFDLIFLDPPYKAGILTDVLTEIKQNNVLNDGGIIIVESDFDNQPDIPHFKITKNKKYGRVSILILEEQ